MTLKRTYAIKYMTPNNQEFYISSIVRYDIGYRFNSTKDVKLSETWKNKKSLDKIIKKLNEGLFQPGFDKTVNSTYQFELIEVTTLKVLRLLKLKKIMK